MSYQRPFTKTKFRRLKTKRLTVYVERQHVCKWSLVYLQVGSYFKAFYGESVFLYSGTVTREVKRGKRDFQDGATGRNAIKGQERKGN